MNSPLARIRGGLPFLVPSLTLGAASSSCLTPQNQSPTSNAPPSQFTESVNGTTRTIDCTLLDRNLADPPVGFDYAPLGSVSASTDEGFDVIVPATAAKLRDPAIVTEYAMAQYSEFLPSVTNDPSQLFLLEVKLVDAQGTSWYSCAKGCGTPSAANHHQVTSVVEEASDAGAGTAAFRISGEYAVQVTSLLAAAPTTIGATGSWSLRVIVPDTGGESDGGGD